MTKSPKGVLALSPAPPAGEAKDDELPGMLAVAKGVSEQAFPHTMDAKVWADEFVKLNSAADHATMLGWFANAIMVGYDTARQREAKDAVPDTLPEYPVLVEIEGGTLNQKLTLYYVYKSDYDALRQHAARLQGELAETRNALFAVNSDNESLMRRLACAEASLEEAKKDAERYRHCRMMKQADWDAIEAETPDALDAAIDAARQGEADD